MRISDYMTALGVDQLDALALLNLLTTWSHESAGELEGAGRDQVLNALANYLDPDGDGFVAVVKWETLQEHGTIGFYVERREPGNNSWQRVNGGLLPGLITAPMGGEYWLADPYARPGQVYEYQLIEQEARGSQQFYGPWKLNLSD